MKKLFFVLVIMMTSLVMNAQTRTVIKVSDLNQAITNSIAKDYTGFAIKEATKVTNNNMVMYDVVISKGTTSETLVYDNAGKFVRKMNQTAGTTGTNQQPKPATTPASKPAPAGKPTSQR
jgi:hypothetical protein